MLGPTPASQSPWGPGQHALGLLDGPLRVPLALADLGALFLAHVGMRPCLALLLCSKYRLMAHVAPTRWPGRMGTFAMAPKDLGQYALHM